MLISLRQLKHCITAGRAEWQQICRMNQNWVSNLLTFFVALRFIRLLFAVPMLLFLKFNAIQYR